MAYGPDRDSYHRVRAVSDIPGSETMLPAPARGKIRLFCPGHSPNPHIWICRVKHKRQAAASTERILLAVPRTSALWVSRVGKHAAGTLKGMLSPAGIQKGGHHAERSDDPRIMAHAPVPEFFPCTAHRIPPGRISFYLIAPEKLAGKSFLV